MHYGPPLESSNPPSGLSTPISEHHRYSDPPTAWDSTGSWRPDHWDGDIVLKNGDDTTTQFADGPPWSEDEDLQSPVVVSSRHRKHSKSRSHGNSRGRGRSRGGDNHSEWDHPGIYLGTAGDGRERYYVNHGREADGPGGALVTYPSEHVRHSTQGLHSVRRDSHFASNLPEPYIDAGPDNLSESGSSVHSSPGMGQEDESRYSRDYQFTIASPDEEMHGKAVALFDFERENENELPLVEGQVIWVSYRHGQGWLVAEDPKTQESGLVPEEYVRLLRDIQGGLNSLNSQMNNDPQLLSPVGGDGGTPTQAEHNESFGRGHKSHPSTSSSNGYQQPVVSTFSTSSKDLNLYPQHLLGKDGQTPPQVFHYHGQRGGSQANTPTLSCSPQADRDTDRDKAGSPTSLADRVREKENTTPVAVRGNTAPREQMEQRDVEMSMDSAPESHNLSQDKIDVR